MDGTTVLPLDRELVLTVVRSIPLGKATTYSLVSKRVFGNVEFAGQVGVIMRDCEDPAVPVHRVVHQSGRLEDNFSRGGPEVWERLLRAEGVSFIGPSWVHMGKSGWNPNSPTNTNAPWSTNYSKEEPWPEGE